jgi:cytochrome c oxidase assembly protein subunit 15
MNAQISLEDFKFIFYMEWAHRNLGRFIGVAFVLPAIYFAARGRLSKRDKLKVLALAGGIGFQVRTPFFPFFPLSPREPTAPAVALANFLFSFLLSPCRS